MAILPTEKSAASAALGDYSMLFHGEPKVGKTTFASKFPNTLFLLTTPAPEALEMYRMRITSWGDYTQALRALRTEDHDFNTFCVDTIDVLFDYCQEHVRQRLGIEHESDLDWGKGWSEVRKEFNKGLARLTSMEQGTIFISHSELQEINTPQGTRTKWVPTLTGQARKIVDKLTAFILFFRVAHRGDEGQVREIRTKAGPSWQAGLRTKENVDFPDPIPMDYGVFTETFEQAIQGDNS